MRMVSYDSLLMAYHAAEELKYMVDFQRHGSVKFPTGDGTFIDARDSYSYRQACSFLDTAKLSLDATDR